MAEKGLIISDGLKWIIGIALTISMSGAGYSIKRDMATNEKLTSIQTNLTQVQEELIQLWEHYNDGLEEKEKIHVALARIVIKLENIEEDLNDLKE